MHTYKLIVIIITMTQCCKTAQSCASAESTRQKKILRIHSAQYSGFTVSETHVFFLFKNCPPLVSLKEYIVTVSYNSDGFGAQAKLTRDDHEIIFPLITNLHKNCPLYLKLDPTKKGSVLQPNHDPNAIAIAAAYTFNPDSDSKNHPNDTTTHKHPFDSWLYS